MLKAAFYQVEQCQEPPEEIRAEMQEFAADVGLGFHAFYMDSPKPWYLSEPSSVLRKMVEDASERKFDILLGLKRVRLIFLIRGYAAVRRYL